MTSNLTAEQHKLKGNDYFKTKAYDDAIQEYSTAIVCEKTSRSLSLSLSLSPSRRCTILPLIYTLTAPCLPCLQVKDPKIAVYYCNRANCYLKVRLDGPTTKHSQF